MDTVLVESPRPHLRVITLNRPERVNAMSFSLVEPLREVLAGVGADADCRAVILRGEGRGFCAGLDLEDAGLPSGCEGLPLSRLAVRAMAGMSDVVPALRALPQPVIAAVHGPAFGGGFCLTLGADVRIAGESARFCGAGVRNGLTGTELGVSWLLPRAIGASRAFEILLTGRELDAREAERIGLVSRVVPDAELLDVALDVAEAMAALSPHGVAMTKRVLWSNLEVGSLEAAIELESRNQLLVRLTTKNLEEAIAARRESRAPVFRD